jgi:hypothetical protein
MSKLWVCMSLNSGMPLEVQKCDFRPTIHPYPNTNWIRVYRENEMTELQELETQIRGHQEAMRPLLQKVG